MYYQLKCKCGVKEFDQRKEICDNCGETLEFQRKYSESRTEEDQKRLDGMMFDVIAKGYKHSPYDGYKARASRFED